MYCPLLEANLQTKKRKIIDRVEFIIVRSFHHLIETKFTFVFDNEKTTVNVCKYT